MNSSSGTFVDIIRQNYEVRIAVNTTKHVLTGLLCLLQDLTLAAHRPTEVRRKTLTKEYMTKSQQI